MVAQDGHDGLDDYGAGVEGKSNENYLYAAHLNR